MPILIIAYTLVYSVVSQRLVVTCDKSQHKHEITDCIHHTGMVQQSQWLTLPKSHDSLPACLPAMPFLVLPGDHLHVCILALLHGTIPVPTPIILYYV